MAFVRATRAQTRLRLALVGPSGSGKTYTALSVARHLGERVAVIDTERASASKYSGDVADFDVCELDDHSPSAYVAAIQEADAAGYDVLVIDSLSHAWMGRGGALEQVDQAAKRSRSGNSFTAWRDVTPQHNRLVDALLQCRAHLIVTMRAKTEYVLQEDSRGKKMPVKIGLAPVQRDGVEYEFDVVADLDHEHNAIVGKTRCPALDGAVIHKPGAELADTLRAWLSDGTPPDTAEVLVHVCAQASDAEALDAARVRIRRVWARLTQEDRARVGAAGEQAKRRIAEAEAEAEAEAAAQGDSSADEGDPWGLTGSE